MILFTVVLFVKGKVGNSYTVLVNYIFVWLYSILKNISKFAYIIVVSCLRYIVECKKVKFRICSM